MATYSQTSGDGDGYSLYMVNSTWYRDFVGQKFSTGHTLIGQAPTAMQVSLKKNGTPNEQFYISHVRGSTLTNLVQIDASSLTTSFTDVDHTFTTTCPTLQDGDMIGVRVVGQTGSSSGVYVRAVYSSTDVDSNSNFVVRGDDTSGFADDTGKDLKFVITYPDSGGGSGGGGSGGGGSSEGDAPTGDGIPQTERLQILSTVVPR